MGALSGIATAFGLYTPTTYGPVNCDSITPQPIHYVHIGNQVLFWGMVTVDPTAATTTSFNISLPPGITSNFAANTDARGVGTAVGGLTAVVSADAANDALTVGFTALGTVSVNITFTGGFEIK